MGQKCDTRLIRRTCVVLKDGDRLIEFNRAEMRRMNQALVFVQRATKTGIHLPIIPFGWFGGVLVALVITCSRLAVSGDNKKKAHDEREVDKKKGTSSLSLPDPARRSSPGRFFNRSH